jgi:hypothetical protein
MSQPSHEEPPHRSLAGSFASIVWKITPHCREVVRLTSQSRDRSLSLAKRLRLGLHRRFCEWCARYAEQLEFLHESAHQLDEKGSQALPSDAKSRLKRALKD